jgi:hypothetical protein
MFVEVFVMVVVVAHSDNKDLDPIDLAVAFDWVMVGMVGMVGMVVVIVHFDNKDLDPTDLVVALN